MCSGHLTEVLEIPLVGSGGGTRIVFNTSLLFPRQRSGELLSRKTLDRATRDAAGRRRRAAGPRRGDVNDDPGGG